MIRSIRGLVYLVLLSSLSVVAAPPATTQPAIPRVKIPPKQVFQVPVQEDLMKSTRVLFVLDVVSPLFGRDDETVLGPQLVGVINRLKENQKFNVLVVGATGIVKLSPDLVPADEVNRKRAADFLAKVKLPTKRGNPRDVVAAALAIPAYRTFVVDHAWTTSAPVVDLFSASWKTAIGSRFIYFVPKGQAFDARHNDVLSALAQDLGGDYRMFAAKDAEAPDRK